MHKSPLLLSNSSDSLMGESGATKLNVAHIAIEQGISSTELEKKLLTPSASSIVLELLGRTAKQKSLELGIIATPSLPSAVRCNHNTAHMSANNPVTITSEGAGDGNPPINLPPSNQKPNHNSVVPQLMDIYDDLAQSSTPQTTTISSVPMTQAPSTMGGVHYPGYPSLDSNSQTSERSTRRRSGSQSPHTAAEADASSATSVALARARRTNATFKADDDLEEHHGGKQPVRKKGKVSSADNRWSKRFTWPDEVSTGHSNVLCGGLIASVQLIISVNTLTVPPPLLCLMPAYLNLTATSKFRIRHFRCRPQACKSFRHPGIHDAKPRHYKRTSQESPAKVSFESSEEPEGIYAKLRLRAGGIPDANGAS